MWNYVRDAVIALAILLASVIGAQAAEGDIREGFVTDVEGSWYLKAWQREDGKGKEHWHFCSVERIFGHEKDKSRSASFGVMMGPDVFAIALVWLGSYFEDVPAGSSVDDSYMFRIDDGPIHRGEGQVRRDATFLDLDQDLNILKEIKNGSRIDIKIHGESVWFNITDSAKAMDQLIDCYMLGWESLTGEKLVRPKGITF